MQIEAPIHKRNILKKLLDGKRRVVDRFVAAPLRYQPGRLVPPGEALRATVEKTNGHNFFLFYMVGWSFMTNYTFAHRVLNTL